MSYKIIEGDCIEQMRKLEESSIDAIVTDPPYGLEFMGKEWDKFKDKKGKKSKAKFPGQTKTWTGKEGSGIGLAAPRFGTQSRKDLHAFQDWTEEWAIEALRVLKPGGHLLAFGGSRTYHRLASAVEDAGFEIRDQIMWLYGSGFPKSLNVSKAIDKHGGYPHLAKKIGAAIKEAREKRGLSMSECDKLYCGGTTNWSWYEGRPTGQRAPDSNTFKMISNDWPELAKLADVVKEAAREVVGKSKNKSGIGNAVEGHYTVGGTRAEQYDLTAPATEQAHKWDGWGTALKPAHEPIVVARKPLIGTVAANVLEHGTGAINIEASRVEGQWGGSSKRINSPETKQVYGTYNKVETQQHDQGRWPANIILDEEASKQLGEPSRFFYCPKAGKKERNAGLDKNTHPTVKPIELMRYLCRLVTPPGGTILDPFLGSGSTGCAAIEEGFEFIGIERDKEYVAICQARLAYWANQTPN